MIIVRDLLFEPFPILLQDSDLLLHIHVGSFIVLEFVLDGAIKFLLELDLLGQLALLLQSLP